MPPPPTWYAAAVAASQGVSSALPGLAAMLFVQTLLAAAGPERVEAFYRAGVLAGAAWAPLGDPARDMLLREWIGQERTQRAIADEGRVIQPLPAWERRPRRDRLPPLPLEPAERVEEASDPAVQAARMARAIAKLEVGEAAVDAMLARVEAALERVRRPTKRL